jgi:hypothetical protein
MPRNDKSKWKKHQIELEELSTSIEEGKINNREDLLSALNSILGPTGKIMGVNYNLIQLLEYCFYKAGNPYSEYFDQYAEIMKKVITVSPGIRRLLNNTSDHAIGNMALGGVGGLKFKIVDQYELIRVLKVWESMGLKKVHPNDVLHAILSKKRIQRRLERGDVLLLARLSEIFPRGYDRFIPSKTKLETALYEYQKSARISNTENAIHMF